MGRLRRGRGGATPGRLDRDGTHAVSRRRIQRRDRRLLDVRCGPRRRPAGRDERGLRDLRASRRVVDRRRASADDRDARRSWTTCPSCCGCSRTTTVPGASTSSRGSSPTAAASTPTCRAAGPRGALPARLTLALVARSARRFGRTRTGLVVRLVRVRGRGRDQLRIDAQGAEHIRGAALGADQAGQQRRRTDFSVARRADTEVECSLRVRGERDVTGAQLALRCLRAVRSDRGACQLEIDGRCRRGRLLPTSPPPGRRAAGARRRSRRGPAVVLPPARTRQRADRGR